MPNIGQFSAVIWQIFCQKILETLAFVIFSADALARLSAFFWQSFRTYLERKKYFRTNFREKPEKNQPKK